MLSLAILTASLCAPLSSKAVITSALGGPATASVCIAYMLNSGGFTNNRTLFVAPYGMGWYSRADWLTTETLYGGSASATNLLEKASRGNWNIYLFTWADSFGVVGQVTPDVNQWYVDFTDVGGGLASSPSVFVIIP